MRTVTSGPWVAGGHLRQTEGRRNKHYDKGRPRYFVVLPSPHPSGSDLKQLITRFPKLTFILSTGEELLDPEPEDVVYLKPAVILDEEDKRRGLWRPPWTASAARPNAHRMRRPMKFTAKHFDPEARGEIPQSDGRVAFRAGDRPKSTRLHPKTILALNVALATDGRC